MAKYDPTKEIPALTSKNQLALESRVSELKERFGELSDTEKFEVLFIEAILAAASGQPLQTVGEAWGPIQFRLTNPPKEMTWTRLKAQMHLASAADATIARMS